FLLGNPLSEVLNNPYSLFNILGSKQSFACNARGTDPNTNFHGILPQEEGTSPHIALCIRWRIARSLLRCQRRTIRCACVSGICANLSSRTGGMGGLSVRKYHISLRQ